MARYGSAVVVASEWIDVSPDQPCSVCGGVEACAAMRDEAFARCMEQQSEWPLIVGGWLHRVQVGVEQPSPV
jgi:hypothetical protein